ncbi:Glycogen synthase kinase [Drechslerella dactyloides]|uniref:Glycogen synthase kinase n=1 Tax=Drechslerella dactyloides TaxID=74499 RepID=A0AAD6J3V9_DREDA|nr:Glycogen synthase kinase [Drechslerella dactyloides]
MRFEFYDPVLSFELKPAAAASTRMPRGAAAPRPPKEQVFFSSRSGHVKTKKAKVPVEKPAEKDNDQASETSSKRRISTIASLRTMKNMALPHSKAHLPAPQRERAGSNGSTTVWGSMSTTGGPLGSMSTTGGHLHAGPAGINPYAAHSEASIPLAATVSSSTFSSSIRPDSSDLPRPSHQSDIRPDLLRRNLESRMSHSSTTSSRSHDSAFTTCSTISEAPDSKFWDDTRVASTVTKTFIEESLKTSKPTAAEPFIQKLDQPVAFGDGLTETTYVEWIKSRAPKLFLTLVEIGVPEHIFTLTDDSWADDDLPVTMESVPRLKLNSVPDPALDKRFHKVQYTYLLRFLYPGGHIDYEEFETIPLEIVHNCSTLFSQPSDHVQCPRRPNILFLRKKFPLVDKDGTSLLDDFLDEIESFRTVSHRHIVELWASYTFKGHGYLLLTPATNFTLRSFLNHPPAEFSKLTEDTRRFKLLDWMRCLSDALAYLYDQGIPHGDIRPRSIAIDGRTGEMYFSDVGSQRRLNFNKSFTANDNERYEYSAPELFQRVAHFNISQAPTALHFDGGRTGRRAPNPVHREPLDGKKVTVVVPPTGADGVEPAHRLSLTAENAPPPPPAPVVHGHHRHDSMQSNASSHASERPPSPHQRTFTASAKGVSTGAVQVAEWVCRPAAKSDVFSLGCIMLDMLTFHSHKKKLSSFPSARSRHNRAAGSRGGGQPDSSFHANIPETIEWIKDLKKEAVKRDDDAVAAVLMLISRMLQKDPVDRPTPREVGDKLLGIMSFVKKPHCDQFIEWTTDSISFSNWSSWDDPHEYSSQSPDSSQHSHEKIAGHGSDLTQPYNLPHHMRNLSFETFGHGSSSQLDRARENSEATQSSQSSLQSQWGSSSSAGSHLIASRAGLTPSQYV